MRQRQLTILGLVIFFIFVAIRLDAQSKPAAKSIIVYQDPG